MIKEFLFHYMQKMQCIQDIFLKYLQEDDLIDENFQELLHFFNEYKDREDRNQLKMVLYLLVHIVNGIQRSENHLNKIQRLIQSIQNDIHKNFSNEEIFYIFESSKILLLLVFDEKILIPNKK